MTEFEKELVSLLKMAAMPIEKYGHYCRLYPDESGQYDSAGRARGSYALADRIREVLSTVPVEEHYNGDAERVFKLMRCKLVSENVGNEHLGVIGATRLEVWTMKYGGMMELRSSNGGQSLRVYQDVNELPCVTAEDLALLRGAQGGEERPDLRNSEALNRLGLSANGRITKLGLKLLENKWGIRND
jgi:hypothetical protein